MATAAPRRGTDQRRRLLVAGGVVALAAVGAGALLWLVRDRTPARSSPAAVLADAASFKGLAASSGGLWWVPIDVYGSRWHYVEVAGTAPAWIGNRVVVAGVDGLEIVSRDSDERDAVLHVPYPGQVQAAHAGEQPLSAAELDDGRVRVAFAEPHTPDTTHVVVVTAAADGRSSTVATFPGANWPSQQVALSPDGTRVAFLDASLRPVTAPGSGGEERTVPGVSAKQGGVAIAWTPAGIVIPLANPDPQATSYVLFLVDPVSGERRRIEVPDGATAAPRTISGPPGLVADGSTEWSCDVLGADPLHPECRALAFQPEDNAWEAVRTPAGTVVVRYMTGQVSAPKLLVQPEIAVGDVRAAEAPTKAYDVPITAMATART